VLHVGGGDDFHPLTMPSILTSSTCNVVSPCQVVIEENGAVNTIGRLDPFKAPPQLEPVAEGFAPQSLDPAIDSTKVVQAMLTAFLTGLKFGAGMLVPKEYTAMAKSWMKPFMPFYNDTFRVTAHPKQFEGVPHQQILL
jgi:hypothetical protein